MTSIRRHQKSYWSCGGSDCKVQHESVGIARRCAKRRARPDNTARDDELWRLVICERLTYAEAGEQHDLSGSRVSQIVYKISRRKPGYHWSKNINDLREMFAGGLPSLGKVRP